MNNTKKNTYKKEYYEANKDKFRKNALAYQKTLGNITIKLKPDALTDYKEAAKKANVSFRAFVLQAIDEKIERDNLK